MAVTWAVTEPTPGAPIVPLQSHGNHRIRHVRLTATGTYTTGGDSVTAAAVALTRVEYGHANIHTVVATNTAADFAIVPAADGSFLVKGNAIAGEVAAAVVLTGVILDVTLWGKN